VGRGEGTERESLGEEDGVIVIYIHKQRKGPGESRSEREDGVIVIYIHIWRKCQDIVIYTNTHTHTHTYTEEGGRARAGRMVKMVLLFIYTYTEEGIGRESVGREDSIIVTHTYIEEGAPREPVEGEDGDILFIHECAINVYMCIYVLPVCMVMWTSEYGFIKLK